MKNRILAVGICAFVVILAAISAGTPTGVAGSNQESQEYWEVTSPSDATLPALRARVQRLEQRVATLENQAPQTRSPEPVRANAGSAAELWQTPTVMKLGPAQPIGQYHSDTTISNTTETVCTGNVCRPQATTPTGPLRRIFRR